MPCIDTYKKVDLRTVSFDVPPQEVKERNHKESVKTSNILFFVCQFVWAERDTQFYVEKKLGHYLLHITLHSGFWVTELVTKELHFSF